MNVLLLDDEAAARQSLRQLLEPYTDVAIVGEAEDVDTALELTRRHKPDVAILDVRLRGETAFDYVGRAPQPGPRVVFITAYDEYAVRGFECNALDYLMKPVLPERLAATLRRIRNDERLQRRAAGADDSVFLRFGTTARLVPWKQVSHLETSGNYTRVITESGETSLVLRPLKDWWGRFPPGMFVQVHRGAVVRVEAIREVRAIKEDRRELVLAGGAAIPASRTYWPGLKQALQDLYPEAANCLP